MISLKELKPVSLERGLLGNEIDKQSITQFSIYGHLE